MTDVLLTARPARSTRAVPPVVTLVMACVLVLLVAPPARGDAPGHVEPGDDDPAAVELIYRSAEAPSLVSYAGTQYVSAWSALDPTAASASAVMMLEHRAGGRTQVTLPNQQAAILEWRDGKSWLAGGGGSAELLVSAYVVSVAGTSTVAGRPAVVVEARRDDGTIAARLWLDSATALTLRRETFDHGGALLNASAFVDIELVMTGLPEGLPDAAPPVNSTASTAGSGAGSSSRRSNALTWSDIEALRAQGWHCPDQIGGGLMLYEARRHGDVVQLSYSDGVMTVSMFEQPGRLDNASLEGYRRVETAGGDVFAAAGPPARYMWSSGHRVMTVVSEAPAAVLDDITTTLPPDTVEPSPAPDDGILARIIRGAKKVGSFLNPFD